MTEMKHTPTPWYVEGDTDILDANGACAATTLFPDSDVATQADYDNATFIVLAVNAHDALVEALEACITDLSAYYDGRNDEDADTDEALTKAVDALALAKGN